MLSNYTALWFRAHLPQWRTNAHSPRTKKRNACAHTRLYTTLADDGHSSRSRRRPRGRVNSNVCKRMVCIHRTFVSRCLGDHTHTHTLTQNVQGDDRCRCRRNADLLSYVCCCWSFDAAMGEAVLPCSTRGNQRGAFFRPQFTHTHRKRNAMQVRTNINRVHDQACVWSQKCGQARVNCNLFVFFLHFRDRPVFLCVSRVQRAVGDCSGRDYVNKTPNSSNSGVATAWMGNCKHFCCLQK